MWNGRHLCLPSGLHTGSTLLSNGRRRIPRSHVVGTRIVLSHVCLKQCSSTSCAAPSPAVLLLHQLCRSSTSRATPPPAVPLLHQPCRSSTSRAAPPPAVPLLHQLCRSSTSCAAPSPAVPLLHQLFRSFTSCASAAPPPAVPLLHQLCRSSTSCAAPPPAVPLLHQLCRSFTSCAAPSPAVPLLHQLCRSSTSCAAPPPAVPLLHQLCRSFTSCAAPPPVVPLLHQLCCSSTSCATPSPAVPLLHQLCALECLKSMKSLSCFASAMARATAEFSNALCMKEDKQTDRQPLPNYERNISCHTPNAHRMSMRNLPLQNTLWTHCMRLTSQLYQRCTIEDWVFNTFVSSTEGVCTVSIQHIHYLN